MEKIIISITKCPYSQIFKKIPDNVDDKQKILNILEEIINDYLRGVTLVASPSLLNISGIPGSGKSTMCKKIMAGSSNLLYISFDEIMKDNRLPYKSAEKKDAQQAFNDWEIVARIVGYELLKRAVEQKKNILFEHSSSIQEHVVLFEWLLKNGYDVHFKYISIPVFEAKKRVITRAEQEGRIVPDGYIETRYEQLKNLLPQYKKLCTTYKEL